VLRICLSPRRDHVIFGKSHVICFKKKSHLRKLCFDLAGIDTFFSTVTADLTYFKLTNSPGEGRKPGVFMNPRVFPNFSTKVVFLMNVDSINSYCKKCIQRSVRFLSTRK